MIKNILFDFDGVILDSMHVREVGFREIFKAYQNDIIDELVHYHNDNGGLSRFVKIRYFFETLLGIPVSDDEVDKYATEFSQIMCRELVKESYQITETVNFIKNNYNKYRLFIVSGSEQNELRYLCSKQGIDTYFINILGSPTEKSELVRTLIQEEGCTEIDTILIGDSRNDYDAAVKNKIPFYGFNAPHLEYLSKHYLINYDILLD